MSSAKECPRIEMPPNEPASGAATTSTKTDSAAPPLPSTLRGLAMTHAERLRWLEQAKRDYGSLLGRARVADPTSR